jgi:hypothetical protein
MVQRCDERDVAWWVSLTVENTWLWNVVDDNLPVRGRDDGRERCVKSEMKNVLASGRFNCVIESNQPSGFCGIKFERRQR